MKNKARSRADHWYQVLQFGAIVGVGLGLVSAAIGAGFLLGFVPGLFIGMLTAIDN